MDRKYVSELLKKAGFEHTLGSIENGVIGTIVTPDGETIMKIRDTRIFAISLKGCGKWFKGIDETVLNNLITDWLYVYNDKKGIDFRYSPSPSLLNPAVSVGQTTGTVGTTTTSTQTTGTESTTPSTAEALIPDDFVYIPRNMITSDTDINELTHCLDDGYHVMLKGPTGSGKSSLARKYCAEKKRPYKRISVNRATTVEDLVGHYILKDGSSPWVDGIIIRAMKEGWILVIDEVNSGDAGVMFVLNSVLDDERMLVLSQKDGEVVKAHKNFRVVTTLNPTELGYAGTQELNDAFYDRFMRVLKIDYNADVERKILTKMGTDADTKKKILDFTKAIRKGIDNGELLTPWSTRSVINLAELMEKGKEKLILYRFRDEEVATVSDLMDIIIYKDQGVDEDNDSGEENN